MMNQKDQSKTYSIRPIDLGPATVKQVEAIIFLRDLQNYDSQQCNDCEVEHEILNPKDIGCQ
jgi:hypothetical protein